MGSESAFQTHSQSHNAAHHLEERHNPHMSRNPISRGGDREFFLRCYDVALPLYEKDTIAPGKRGK